MSGETHASVGANLVGLSARASSISLGQLRANMTAGMRPGAALAQSDGALPASAWPSSKALPAWAEVVGHWQTLKGDANAASTRQHTGGVFVGADQVLASDWRVGGSLGYTKADGNVAERNARSKVNSYSAALYGGKSFAQGDGHLNVLGGLAYTWHDIASERQMAPLGQTLKADYNANTTQLFAEVGYALGQYGKVGVEPFVGINVADQRTRGFQERGGFAALRAESSRDTHASSTLGVRGHTDFKMGRSEGRLRATLGWRHAFGDVQAQKTMAFEGAQNFTVAGTPLARNAALVGLEAELELNRRAALVLGYRGEYGSGNRDHAASVKVRWAF